MGMAFYFFLLSIPFGYRVILNQWTIGFDEYETAFLYFSDFLLLFFLFFYIWCKRKKIYECIPKNPLALIFVILAANSIYFALWKELALYNFIRLFLLVFLSFAIGDLIKNNKVDLKSIFGILAALSLLEACLGIAQFFFQRSMGLYFLGEPLLGLGIKGSSKILVENTEILRAYGSFPHPNIFGAFLILGLISMYYFWLRRPSDKKIWSGFKTLKSDLIFGLSIFLLIFALLLTFSRTAWIIAFLVTFLFCLPLLFSRFWIQAVRLMFLIFSIVIILINTFWPFVFTRAKISNTEPAVTYRVSYNKLGLELIKKNPFGIGIGNQVIYSVKKSFYQEFGMKSVWEWQPVHNIYILIASEIGILGLIIFSFFVIGPVLNNHFLFRSIFSEVYLLEFLSKVMLLVLLVFGFVDHFLWTLQPGRLMFWVVFGVVLGIGYDFRKIDR